MTTAYAKPHSADQSSDKIITRTTASPARIHCASLYEKHVLGMHTMLSARQRKMELLPAKDLKIVYFLKISRNCS